MTNGRGLVLCVALVAAGGCLASDSVFCDDGTVCPAGQLCAPAGHRSGCVLAEQLQCEGQADGASCRYPGVEDGVCRGGVCVARAADTCGNGAIDEGEACDCGDGSATPPDPCTGPNSTVRDATCRPDCRRRRCGDGVLDTGEVCDLGDNLDGDGCNAACTSDETCGNGTRDPAEECDDGNAEDGDSCHADCSLPRCGDGKVDPGEACDDGDSEGGDGCSANCRSDESCGNAYVDFAQGEYCDEGADNSDEPDAACRTDCTPARCGDGVVDPGEVCDDGGNLPFDGCAASCLSDETCGNGIVDPGEACDDGDNDALDGCSADCRSDESCGNGVVDLLLHEACDLGRANSDEPDAACRTDCLPARCGDAILDADRGERCDVGDTIGGDGCSADCLSDETCGNGTRDFVRGEACDDGDRDGGDGCSADCLSDETCGNGHADLALGEQCDLGSSNSDAPDAPCRTDCLRQRCGDGVLDPSFEVCDDGNVADGDGCAASCLSDETCGNGFFDHRVGEECDDANLLDHDGCTACRAEQPRWTRIEPQAWPMARTGAAMAWDAGRGKLVLFGGSDLASSAYLNDTWEWDGRWTLREPTRFPPGRTDAAMAYDPVRRRIVLFGGSNTAELGDTWLWDGTRPSRPWTLLRPSPSPSPRTGHAMVYDAARRAVVLFGGHGVSATGEPAYLDDTWIFRYELPVTEEGCLGPGFDGDGDGLAGCDDPDCFGRCDPVCSPAAPACDPTWPHCGDGECTQVEDCRLCPGDCDPCAGVCGDLVFDPGEDRATCPGDFPGEQLCDDALDDDGDRWVDCLDPDCAGVAPCELAEASCGDSIDNDGDGYLDCADPSCAGLAGCERPEASCGDLADNDGDGDADCADDDCLAAPGCAREAACGDGLDDDGDGAADCADPDCATRVPCFEVECADALDDDGDGSIDCADPDCGSGLPCAEVACDDGADDDGDGATDCADPDCALACAVPACPPGAALLAYRAVGLPVPIPEEGTAVARITVPWTGTVATAAVGLSIAHTYDADLTLRLRSPEGPAVTLAEWRGDDGDDFTGTIFHDGAATPIAQGVAPFTGAFAPEAPLALLAGSSLAGTWRLSIVDGWAPDGGAIVSWQLALCALP